MFRIIFLLILLMPLLFSCEEDFEIQEPNHELPVIYAFLEHKDPWGGESGHEDTNFVSVDKSFLGLSNKYEMASVSDSVNFQNYDDIKVSLQRVESDNIESKAIGEPILLNYTSHYKDDGVFARDNNIVYYTTQALMDDRNIKLEPEPKSDDNYYYKLSVNIPGKKEAYAITKMIRGITEGQYMQDHRVINLTSIHTGFNLKIDFLSNKDARIYDLSIRTYYYEKKKDGNIYLDYIDYKYHLPIISRTKGLASARMQFNIPLMPYLLSFTSQLSDTSDIIWRVPKTRGRNGLSETNAVIFTLGSQETYAYLMSSQFSDGPEITSVYGNITNGLGLFTSKWNCLRGGFAIAESTVDSIALNSSTKHLKFKSKVFTGYINDIVLSKDVIKRY